MGGAMLSKSLIQFSVGGWGCVLSLLFDLRPNYGGGNKDNGDLLHLLGWPWEAPSSIRVARESWGLRSSHCRGINLIQQVKVLKRDAKFMGFLCLAF